MGPRILREKKIQPYISVKVYLDGLQCITLWHTSFYVKWVILWVTLSPFPSHAIPAAHWSTYMYKVQKLNLRNKFNFGVTTFSFHFFLVKVCVRTYGNVAAVVGKLSHLRNRGFVAPINYNFPGSTRKAKIKIRKIRNSTFKLVIHTWETGASSVLFGGVICNLQRSNWKIKLCYWCGEKEEDGVLFD